MSDERDVFTYAIQVANTENPGAWHLSFFETDADMDELYEALAEDGVIRGKRLVIAKRTDGSAYVKRAQDIIYTRQMIGSITPASAPGSKRERAVA